MTRFESSSLKKYPAKYRCVNCVNWLLMKSMKYRSLQFIGADNRDWSKPSTTILLDSLVRHRWAGRPAAAMLEDLALPAVTLAFLRSRPARRRRSWSLKVIADTREASSSPAEAASHRVEWLAHAPDNDDAGACSPFYVTYSVSIMVTIWPVGGAGVPGDLPLYGDALWPQWHTHTHTHTHIHTHTHTQSNVPLQMSPQASWQH